MFKNVVLNFLIHIKFLIEQTIKQSADLSHNWKRQSLPVVFLHYFISARHRLTMLIIVRAFRHSCSLGRVNQLHTRSKLISNIELHCRAGIAKGAAIINGNVRGLQTSQTLLSGIRCLSQRSIQHQLILIRRQPQECSIRWFHRSQRHQAQPLLLLMIFKSIAKISAVISGR